jgi:phenylalanyl-tRNA synthetase beta chain
LVSAGADGYSRKTLTLRLSRLESLLGIRLPSDEAVGALARLHLSPSLQGDTITVQVPSWRLDLNIEADLIEEIARLIGYGRLPSRQEIAIRVSPPDRPAQVLETIRRTLVAAGFFEAVTFSFVSDSLKEDFFPAGSHALRADAAVRKADATLRPSIVPGLLEAVRRNHANGAARALLFEAGSVYFADAKGAPDERRMLALVGGTDWHDMRGVIEGLLNKLDAHKAIGFTAASRSGFAQGACAEVHWDAKPIGFAGLIDRAVADKLSIKQAPMGAELDLSRLLGGAATVAKLTPLPQFPPARRDLSLVVDEGVAYDQIERTLREAKPANLDEIEYLTTFRGKPLEAGKKSISVTLVFRSATGTLNGEQVEAAVAVAFAAAAEKIGATLRQ